MCCCAFVLHTMATPSHTEEVPCDFVYALGCPEPASVILSRVANLSLVLPPGLHPSYSNLGFAVLGRGLEGVSGGTWEEHVVSRVIRPLGMNTTGPNVTSMVCAPIPSSILSCLNLRPCRIKFSPGFTRMP